MPKPSKKKHYLTNKFFMEVILEAISKEIITDRLGRVFLTLVTNLQRKSNWHNYPKQVKDEMISNALCDLCGAYNKFNPEKSNNPFAYFTTIANNSFKKTINKEKSYLSFVTFMTQMSEHSNTQMYRKHMTMKEGVKRWVETKDDEYG